MIPPFLFLRLIFILKYTGDYALNDTLSLLLGIISNISVKRHLGEGKELQEE